MACRHEKIQPMRTSLLLAACLPLVGLADVPARMSSASPPVLAPTGAEDDYQQGVRYATGDGVSRDYSLAAKYYRIAAEKGMAAAQCDLAYLYESGLGVNRDPKLAAIWYRKAALQGDAEAQNNLGVLYSQGQGVARNAAAAVHWFRLAAAQSDPEGTCNLGMMYLKGRGVKRDPARAFQLLQKAADRGYAVAQNNLGLLYANGDAGIRDFVWAYAWLDIAAGELTVSEGLRDKMAKEMTAGQISQARDLAGRKREELARKRP